VDTWAGPVRPNESHLLPNLFQQFLSNVQQSGQAEHITPVRMSSHEAAMALDVRAEIVYIDDDHSALGAYTGTCLWWGHVKENGRMVFDDWEWWTVQDGVSKAVKELAPDTTMIQWEGSTAWVER
jgi:hypothetical protein